MFKIFTREPNENKMKDRMKQNSLGVCPVRVIDRIRGTDHFRDGEVFKF